MSCNNKKGCRFNKNMQTMQQAQLGGNYCTSRTINTARDTYNEDWFDYGTLQDRYVHHNARSSIHPMNGFQGCLGCASDKPICPSQSGIAYPHHVGVDSRLRGL